MAYATASDLPPELKSLITKELIMDSHWNPASWSSLAMVWRESWNDIRAARFMTVRFLRTDAMPSRLERLLALVSSANTIVSCIKTIEMGHPRCYGIHEAWFGEREILPRLAVLVSLSKNLKTMKLYCLSPHSTRTIPEGLPALTDVLRASQIEHLLIGEYTFISPGWLVYYLSMFPRIKKLTLMDLSFALRARDPRPEPDAPTRTIEPNRWLRSLRIFSNGDGEMQFLEAIMQRDIFPNIACLDYSHTMQSRPSFSENFLPAMRHFLPYTSSTLVSLTFPELNHCFFSAKEERPFEFPPLLKDFRTTLDLPFRDRKCIHLLASSILNSHISHMSLLVRYTDKVLERLPSLNNALRALDDVLASKIDHLVWEGRCGVDSEMGNDAYEERAKQLDEWLFSDAFPKVNKKFFADMPKVAVSNVLEKGRNGSRIHKNVMVFNSVAGAV
ncbi:hypothetical protein CYLTODRAFT_419795 [Cylindrobasidium torrendii FP15055 ss-10]|uniref:F-box domain-containing protein n=1 Tax=Cylindrobasidium torrendii FP15055 ss-10 TaxID=1314674 RepID=A0A0D7BJ07_9AGAR|nr:hypothetical protein CYLTODRAFT_419795 [Cylindrobasidium torrendii FP15055 ss-10]